MNTQQILVIVIIVAALISVVLVSFLVTTTHTLLLPANTKTTATITIFQEPNNNKIQDSRGDAKLISLYKTDIFPKVRDYHDILSAVDLAGDANKNEKYETVYLWLINYTDSLNGTAQKFYTVIIPNFAADSNFKNKHGWTFNYLVSVMIRVHSTFLDKPTLWILLLIMKYFGYENGLAGSTGLEITCF
jgi:hypothetical protein